jgi:hypothetical protein
VVPSEEGGKVRGLLCRRPPSGPISTNIIFFAHNQFSQPACDFFAIYSHHSKLLVILVFLIYFFYYIYNNNLAFCPKQVGVGLLLYLDINIYI